MRRPQGECVDSTEAPRLFELLTGLQRRLKAPPFARVVVTAEFNASVLQASRLGRFGRGCTYLLLGLPLMKALTLEQFAAVLAHELGHVVCGHGRTASPQHRIRRLWARIEATFQQTAASDAACLPLARRNEYEADAMAARLTSPRGAAQALTSVTLIGCYLEHRYWPAVYAAAREAAAGDPAAGESAQCELAPISGFHLQAISAVPAEQLRQWQDSALKRRAGVRDTHPSLGDRLEALGESAEFAPPGPGKSADRLLGDALLRIEQALDLRWRKRVAKGRFSSRRSPF